MGGAGGFSGSVLRQNCRVKGAKSSKAISKSRTLPSVLTNLISQGKVDGAQERSLTDRRRESWDKGPKKMRMGSGFKDWVVPGEKAGRKPVPNDNLNKIVPQRPREMKERKSSLT